MKDGRISIDHAPRSWEEKQAQLEKDAREQNFKGGAKNEEAQPTATAVPRGASAAAAAAPAPATPMASAAPGFMAPAGDLGTRTADTTTSRPEPDQQPADERRARGPQGNARVAIDGDDPWASNLTGMGTGGGGHGQGFGNGAGQAAGGVAAGDLAGASAAGEAARPRAITGADIPAPAPTTAPAAHEATLGGLTTPTPSRPRHDGPPSAGAPRITTMLPQQAEAPQPQVRAGALVVQGGIGQDEVQRVVRSALPRIRACYTRQLQSTPGAGGHVDVSVAVDALGEVKSADASGGLSPDLKSCVTGVFRSVRFPAPGTGVARFTASFDLVPSGNDSGEVANNPNVNVPKAAPYDGRFKVVMDRLAQGDKDGGLDEAKRWQADQPGDIMALVALGEAYEARGDVKTAARAYGSILELFSFRADSRRFAGERLERLADASAVRLAADTYGKAAEQRPDHPASHRLFAFTLLKAGEHEKAFEAMKKGAMRSYPSGRFAGADRILKEDLGLIASVWAAAAPARRAEIMTKLHAAGGTEETAPSLRFVLVWETDANDVDFHIHDGKGGHAYYGNRQLASGGELYADVTTGYGPECFTIRGAREKRAYPYTLQAHYYSRGPMGYGMGKLEVVDHDGQGAHLVRRAPVRGDGGPRVCRPRVGGATEGDGDGVAEVVR